MTQRELGNCVQSIGRGDTAGGIPGEIQDQRASARADQGGDALSIQPPHFIERVADRDRPGEPHDRRVDRKARVRHEHFVACLEDGEQGVKHHRLGPRNDDHVLCRRPRPYTPPRERCSNRIAQRGEPGRVHITGVAVVQGADGCLHYGGGSRPIGLADLEVDHVAAGVLEAARRHQHLERTFAREGGDSTGRDDGHGPPPKRKRPLK